MKVTIINKKEYTVFYVDSFVIKIGDNEIGVTGYNFPIKVNHKMTDNIDLTDIGFSDLKEVIIGHDFFAYRDGRLPEGSIVETTENGCVALDDDVKYLYDGRNN